jgi:hypothetical protein
MTRPITIGIQIAILVVASGACKGDVITVCELLDKMPAFDGEVVSVRGIYSAGSEISGIYDYGCRAQISYKDRKWEPGIWIASWPKPPNKAEFDYEAFDTLVKAHREARAAGRIVTAVFEGKLKCCPIHARDRSGAPRWVGCGFLGNYPLEMVVRTVRDVRIEERK